MKKFYSRFRVMLMTFALGLASVFVSNGSLKFSEEIYIDLPKTQSDSVIFVTPKKHICMPFGGVSHANHSQRFITAVYRGMEIKLFGKKGKL